jgi:hypothetical protein
MHQPADRNTAIRQQYRARRYASHLSQPELDRRIRDIVLNMLALTPDAKIGPRPIAKDGPIWWDRFTQALEEMQLRHGPTPMALPGTFFIPSRFRTSRQNLQARRSNASKAWGWLKAMCS